MPLNLDLSELEELTLRDSLAAGLRLGARTRRALERAMQQQGNLSVQISSAVKLALRLQTVAQLREQVERRGRSSAPGSLPQNAPEELPPAEDSSDGAPGSLSEAELAQQLQRDFEVLEALLVAGLNRQVLSDELEGDPLRLFQRRLSLARSLLQARRTMLRRNAGPQGAKEEAELDALERRIDALQEDLRTAIRGNAVDGIDRAVAQAPELLREAERLTRFAPEQLSAAAVGEQMTPLLQRLFQAADRMTESGGALPQVEISVDDAMLTAVTRRYELANAREQLADAWRQIKLRGDDLRSGLTWRFRHSLRTPRDLNRPFSFSFNDSDTSVALSFDAPLNRLAERNAFRQSLIDYNQQLRSLIGLEDQIKLAVRNDLRNLELARNQYRIAVDSAALASERVNSTRLQLDLGRGTARDFLEAQQAYTASLSAVASEHIGYLVDRLALFLDLEQLEVDELGFWDSLYDETAKPRPRTEMPVYGMSAYGDLPNVRYSRRVRRMLDVPAGHPSISHPVESLPSGRQDERLDVRVDSLPVPAAP